jgi:hypothetical protein
MAAVGTDAGSASNAQSNTFHQLRRRVLDDWMRSHCVDRRISRRELMFMVVTPVEIRWNNRTGLAANRRT